MTYAPAEAAGGPTCLPKYPSWQEGVSPRLSSRHSISLFNDALGLGSDKIFVYFSPVCLYLYTFTLGAAYQDNYLMSNAVSWVTQRVQTAILKLSPCSVMIVITWQVWLQRAYTLHAWRQKFRKAFRRSRGKCGKVWWVAHSKALKSALVGLTTTKTWSFFPPMCEREQQDCQASVARSSSRLASQGYISRTWHIWIMDRFRCTLGSVGTRFY